EAQHAAPAFLVTDFLRSIGCSLVRFVLERALYPAPAEDLITAIKNRRLARCDALNGFMENDFTRAVRTRSNGRRHCWSAVANLHFGGKFDSTGEINPIEAARDQ